MAYIFVADGMFVMTSAAAEHTAIHEAGHAIMELAVGGSPRFVEVLLCLPDLRGPTMGSAGGAISELGEAKRIAVLLGGEAATHVLLGDDGFEALREEAVEHLRSVHEARLDTVSEYVRFCDGRVLDFAAGVLLDQDPEDIEYNLTELAALEGSDTVRAMRLALAEQPPVGRRSKSGRKRSERTLCAAELERAKLAEKRILSDWERVVAYLSKPKPRAAVERIAKELAKKGRLSGARLKKLAGVVPRFKPQPVTPWWCAA